MKEKIVFFILGSIIVTASIVFNGCGTDVRPSSFVNIFRDTSDIDDLAQCLTETPTDDGNVITVRASKQCLIDFSNGDISDELTFEKILINPTAYLAKRVTFSANVQTVRRTTRDDVEYPYQVELYTNTVSVKFTIHNPTRMPFDVQENQTYEFTCRVYELKRHANHGGVLEINANFITNEAGGIEHLPVLLW